MKYCSHCGNQLADEAVICPQCGCAAGGAAQIKNENNSDVIAILGFVFSFITALVGLVLSVIAYKSAVAEDNKRNKNFAVAGIVISSVSLGSVVIAVFIYVILLFTIFASAVPPVIY